MSIVSPAIVLLFIANIYQFMARRELQSVAVVGGGFTGLASTYLLLKKIPALKNVQIFDLRCAGKADGSSVAAGIMHPMTPKGKVIWYGREGMSASLAIMNEIQEVSGYPVYRTLPILRPIMNETEKQEWVRASINFPDLVEMVDNARFETMIRKRQLHKQAMCAMELKTSVLVDSQQYLRALWEAIRAKCSGAAWASEAVPDLKSLHRNFDAVIVAAGAGSLKLWNQNDANYLKNVGLVKGQNLLYNQEGDTRDIAILRGEYCVPNCVDAASAKGGRINCLVVGATHEHMSASSYDVSKHFPIIDPNSAAIARLLQDRAPFLLPGLQDARPFAQNAGVRVVPARSHLGRLPICARHSDQQLANAWLATGFGSRGLVHHAVVADFLCKAIAANDATLIPPYLATTSSTS